jgi:uncharacterized protein YkwD
VPHRAGRILCMLVVVALAAPGVAAARTDGGPSDDMIQAVNSTRANHGLAALRPSPQLTRTSQAFSEELLSTGTFGHRARIDGGPGFSTLGEALAMHSGRSLGIRSTVRQWLASPGHRALVLSKTMRWVGTGVSRGGFRGGSATIWVLRVGRG